MNRWGFFWRIRIVYYDIGNRFLGEQLFERREYRKKLLVWRASFGSPKLFWVLLQSKVPNESNIWPGFLPPQEWRGNVVLHSPPKVYNENRIFNLLLCSILSSTSLAIFLWWHWIISRLLYHLEGWRRRSSRISMRILLHRLVSLFLFGVLSTRYFWFFLFSLSWIISVGRLRKINSSRKTLVTCM